MHVFLTTCLVFYELGRLTTKALVVTRTLCNRFSQSYWLALFGHVRRLPEGAPAHDALQVYVELLAGTTYSEEKARKTKK